MPRLIDTPGSSALFWRERGGVDLGDMRLEGGERNWEDWREGKLQSGCDVKKEFKKQNKELCSYLFNK